LTQIQLINRESQIEPNFTSPTTFNPYISALQNSKPFIYVDCFHEIQRAQKKKKKKKRFYEELEG
jgi:hypothetical protein